MKSEIKGGPQEDVHMSGTAGNHRTDRAEVTARFVRTRAIGPRWTDMARQDRRAESILYTLLGVGALFGIGAHLATVLPAAHQMEVSLHECLRLAGLC